MSEKFGSDFDKYLIKELIDQIDLKDPNRAARDKNEGIKSTLLSQVLSSMCRKPEFLKYFDEVSVPIVSGGADTFAFRSSPRECSETDTATSSLS